MPPITTENARQVVYDTIAELERNVGDQPTHDSLDEVKAALQVAANHFSDLIAAPPNGVPLADLYRYHSKINKLVRRFQQVRSRLIASGFEDAVARFSSVLSAAGRELQRIDGQTRTAQHYAKMLIDIGVVATAFFVLLG